MDAGGASSGRGSDANDAVRFGELYSAIYRRFHRADPPDAWRPSTEALALLDHLSATGPLTVAEASKHFGRSQAATSELIARLEKRGLLERMPDERDRRRTLVWMSPTGLDAWRKSYEVLANERVAAALASVPESDRATLFRALEALLDAPTRLPDPPRSTKDGD